MELREWLAIAMFGSFIALIFTGFPIAWVLGGLAVLFTAIGIIAERDFGIFTGIDWSYTSLVVDRSWDVMNNWVLVALPMFVFMGLMLDRSGIATELMRNFSRLFGRVRGGLAITVAVIGVLLAASTGIIGASVVLLALLGLPIMLEHGYRAELAAGILEYQHPRATDRDDGKLLLFELRNLSARQSDGARRAGERQRRQIADHRVERAHQPSHHTHPE